LGIDSENGQRCALRSIIREALELGRFGVLGTVLVANHPREPLSGYFEQFSLNGEGEFELPSLGNDRWRGFPLDPGFRDAFDPEDAPRDLNGVSMWHGKLASELFDYQVPSPEELPEEARDPLLLEIRDYRCGDGHPANALGGVRFDPGGDMSFPGPVDDWFRWMATTGLPVGLGASGGGTLQQEIGAPRTWIHVGQDPARGDLDRRPASLLDEDVVLGLLRGRAIVSNGPFLELKVRTGSARADDYILWDVGELVRYGAPSDTGARAATALVELRSAPWMRVERIRLRVNGDVVADVGVPDAELIDGKRVDEGWLFPIEFSFSEDAYVTAEALGSQNLFPIITPTEHRVPGLDDALDAVAAAVGVRRRLLERDGLRGPARVDVSRPFAITNPVLIDFDASGAFNPPGVDAIPGPAPDLVCGN
jgi:hypothetical protein